MQVYQLLIQKQPIFLLKTWWKSLYQNFADENIYDLIFEVKYDCTFTNVDVITEVLLKRFSYDELRAATDDFDHVIGGGRLGMVYEVHI